MDSCDIEGLEVYGCDTCVAPIPPDAAVAWKVHLLCVAEEINANGSRPALERLVLELAKSGLVPSLKMLADAQDETRRLRGLLQLHGILSVDHDVDAVLRAGGFNPERLGGRGKALAASMIAQARIDSTADRE